MSPHMRGTYFIFYAVSVCSGTYLTLQLVLDNRQAGSVCSPRVHGHLFILEVLLSHPGFLVIRGLSALLPLPLPRRRLPCNTPRRWRRWPRNRPRRCRRWRRRRRKPRWPSNRPRRWRGRHRRCREPPGLSGEDAEKLQVSLHGHGLPPLRFLDTNLRLGLGRLNRGFQIGLRRELVRSREKELLSPLDHAGERSGDGPVERNHGNCGGCLRGGAVAPRSRLLRGRNRGGV